MATPFLGELRLFSFSVIPKGWAQCNGQLLPINQNQALFALLGTMYGGNGQTTFALPNLQGRVPAHAGPTLTQGQVVGEEIHTLSSAEMAAHTHTLSAATASAGADSPAGALPAVTTSPVYAAGTNPSVTLSPQMTSSVGGGLPHENRQPYITLSVCIALTGIFPSRN